MLFQAVVWQKSKVSDHGAALMAVLGSSTAANLLPVRHRHEQAEVSHALGNGDHTQREFWVLLLSLFCFFKILYQDKMELQETWLHQYLWWWVVGGLRQ